MLLNFSIDNYKGVSKEINISCIASNKIKHQDGDFSKISDKTKILKNICLIGNNASGKTSILSAIETIQNFLLFPYRKNITKDKDYAEFIRKMSPDELKEFLIEMNTLHLGEQNNVREHEDTNISIELFCPKREKNISGIYRYTLIYNSNYAENGVLLEKLEYKETIDSKRYEIICLGNNIIESEISTTILYQNNKSKNIKIDEKINYYKTFFNEVVKHIIYLDRIESANLIDVIKNNQKKFVELCNIADDKIINVTLDENKKNPQILFWNSKKSYLKYNQLSNGTKKIIVLGSIILDSLNRNNLLLIDEIELSLHPSLATFLVQLNMVNNINNYSQLIFTTHSPLLAFSMTNDQLFYINNTEKNYIVCSINDAIKKGIITKDKNPEKAWAENMIIKNPDEKKIANFLNN